MLIMSFLAPATALSFIAVSIHYNPWFRFRFNALSDLGNPASNYPVIFNLGLIISGVMNLLFSIGLFSLCSKLSCRFSTAILMVGSICLSLIGVFPENSRFHSPSAAMFYLLEFIGLYMYSLHFFHIDRLKSLSIITILTLCLLILLLHSWHGLAIPELVGAAGIWVSSWITATHLMKEL